MSSGSKGSPGVNDKGFDAAAVVDAKTALEPATVKVNEERVREGLIPKLRKVAAKLPFATDVMALWYCARDPATPATAKGMMLAGLAYFILPADAIPDIIPGLGFTDDAAVIGALIALLGRTLKPHHKQAALGLLSRFGG